MMHRATALAAAALLATGTAGSAQNKAANALEEAAAAAAEDAAAAFDTGRPRRERGDLYRLTATELEEFAGDRLSTLTYPAPLFDGWRGALKRELAKPSLPRASATLAGQYGIAPAAMEELARLWLAGELHRFGFERDPGAPEDFRARMLAAVARADRAPLAEEIAAQAIDELLECDAKSFDTLVAGSPDPFATAWRVTNLAPCEDNFARFAERFPERATPALIRQVHWGVLAPPAALPLYAWLAGDEGLSHVAVADRERVRTWLVRQLAGELFALGLDARAVELLDSLPGAVREPVLAAELPGFAATIDGLEVRFEPDRESHLGLNLAIAYFNAGRREEAERLLAALPALADARAAFDCSWDEPRSAAARPTPECRELAAKFRNTVDALILDRALHDPAADPYPLAEAGFSGTFGTAESGPRAELRCRYFAEAQFGDICVEARRSVRGHARLDPADYRFADSARIAASIERLGLPGWTAHRQAFTAALAERTARDAVAPPDSERRWGESVDPVVPPFAVHPVPAAARSARPDRAESDDPPRWPRGWAELPAGFAPVRWERTGARAAAVSLSRLVDPSGEVSAGGYWVHLSDDGGKTWHAPHYTGLSQFFPYVVRERSKLPLLAGDALHLEVLVAELDTASITYPPVALRTRRTEADLYLELPLAELSSDSDGDGLTDLVESHLLLDLPPERAPFVVGTEDRASCAEADAGLREVRLKLLARIVGLDDLALIEPVDRSEGDPLAGGWTRVESGEGWPLYLKGDREDFACLPANGLTMIVYGEAHEAELQRRTPDFRLLEMPRIVMNRAGDRGYVIWSAGWAGGTLRVRRTGDEWVVDELSSWIT